jgi:hypothetical protein
MEVASIVKQTGVFPLRKLDSLTVFSFLKQARSRRIGRFRQRSKRTPAGLSVLPTNRLELSRCALFDQSIIDKIIEHYQSVFRLIHRHHMTGS